MLCHDKMMATMARSMSMARTHDAAIVADGTINARITLAATQAALLHEPSPAKSAVCQVAHIIILPSNRRARNHIILEHRCAHP